MPALSLDHWNVYCKDLKATVRFYERYVGLKDGDRPPFNFPGAWLYAGGRPVLHVIAGRELPTPRGGVLDHMAFSASGLAAVKDRLEAMGVPYDLRRLPDASAWQLFCLDPSGAKVELDFDPAESA